MALLGEAPAPGMPNFDSLSALDLIDRGIETERVETVPLDQILTEEGIVDYDHVDELGASMKQKRGQITPIVVRPRIDEAGLLVYDIIDGFHRSEARMLNGDKTIMATVIYGCSDEEMYDLRILAASSVRSVQFARIAKWITLSWSKTVWFQSGLTVPQAFAIALNDTQKSTFVALPPNELSDVKTWVQEKSALWGRSAGSTYNILGVVSNADPELVAQVRSAGRGKASEGKITPARLEKVVDIFPGEENYPAQRAILRAAVARHLSTTEVDKLGSVMRSLVVPGMAEEEIFQVALITPFPEAPFSKKPQRRRSTSSYIVRPDRHDPITDYGDDVASLQERIANLEAALEKARAEGVAFELWWRTAPYLSDKERVCMERILYANHDMRAVCAELRITDMQAISLMISAFTNRHLEESQLDATI